MPRVLICDELGAGGVQMLQAAGLEVDNRPGLKEAALTEALRAADGAIVRSGTRIGAAQLENPGRLRAIARAGVGVDNIDVAAATRRGIVVMNTPDGNTLSAAEHTIALMLALARHIPTADAQMRAGKWNRKLVGVQLTGKTLGVVGLGRIGQAVAKRALGLEMKVLGYDPFPPERIAEMHIELVGSVDELMGRCDFLTIHAGLTDSTRGLIGQKQFALARPGLRLLNVARGGIVDESALIEALKAGRIAGAALDVYETEPLPADHPLLSTPNLVLTPHLGASTVEAQENVAREAASLLIDYLTRGVIQSAVNMAAVDRNEREAIRAYVDLARRLGLLQAQSCDGVVRRVVLTYRGEVARRSTRLLTTAFTAGLLEYRLGSEVNAVNAELLARERGIEIVQSISDRTGDFSTLIHTELITDQATTIAAGTLFGNDYPRVVQLGQYRLEAYLDGVLLVFTHQDVPGLIGFIGTIFGARGVNIAQMNVGRRQPGGEAIAVLNLDSTPPDDALAELARHPKIASLRVVKLPAAGELPAWFG
jgi:D-3-phosphoglycerate dehydrogenase